MIYKLPNGVEIDLGDYEPCDLEPIQSEPQEELSQLLFHQTGILVADGSKGGEMEIG